MLKLTLAALVTCSAGAALAQSNEWMTEDCTAAVQGFFRDYEAKVELKSEGQRTDGSRPFNGTIYLETKAEDFQCSYDKSGTKLIGFFAEGKDWPAFVKDGTSPHG